ncbi:MULTISPECIES: Gp138 family membrane-puncturing spike protein [Acetobacter]|uniref:Gp138 family membrane-puncturing spike protein n=1 Tax=Acetobacter oryzoeni TaxID=2500548 RepID=UPI001FCB203B|nr:Gp138 family membrane-puncturing spike protein [Acetobacter oryzoeni]MCP1202238.1 baseplate assembly protein [Acetobacter oryzoeni]
MSESKSFDTLLRARDLTSQFGALSAVVRNILNGRRTALLVQVQAVSGSGLNPVGFVDVIPMVHQQDGAGGTVPHGVIYDVPYFRLQGGHSAVIVDPTPGDIGIAIISDRDIANVKASRKSAAPGSYAQQDIADALYVGGFLNSVPHEYIWLTGSGVKIKTSGAMDIEAGSVKIGCDVSVSGDISASGDVKAGNISLTKHKHSGVQPGSGTTAPPE